jgi:hypothetical protein
MPLHDLLRRVHIAQVRPLGQVQQALPLREVDRGPSVGPGALEKHGADRLVGGAVG